MPMARLALRTSQSGQSLLSLGARRTALALAAFSCSALLFLGCGGGGGAGPVGANPAAKPFVYDENPATYVRGLPIPPNRPSQPPAAGVLFEANPPLPDGLTLDPATGIIRGTPTGSNGMTACAIAGRAGDVSVSTTVTIQITDPLVLVSETLAEAPVYWWGGDDERSAAEMLAQYLARISGRNGFSAAPGPVQVPSRALLVGRVPYPGFELAGQGRDDEFVIRVRADCIQLTGRCPRSTHYAVSTYLERCLGCRFWAMVPPDQRSWEEDVPAAFPLLSPRPNLRILPAMELRDAGSGESRNVSYGLRRLTTTNGYSLAGSVDFHAPHNMHSLVEDAVYGAYAATHPEIYPCANPGPGTLAERARNNLHLCYTDPGLPLALANALSVDVEARGRDLKRWIYNVGQGDWYGGQCQCDRCRAVYAEETWVSQAGNPKLGYSGTLIRMMNRVAELMEARYPGIRVGTFAYMGTEAPCGLTRPRSNLAIRVPHLRHCIVHGVDECDANGSYWNNLRGWLAHDQGGGVYVWDYSQLFPDGFFYSAPNLYSIARSLKAYANHGVRGAYTQGCNVSTGGDMVVLKNWVFGKLMVDPRLDVDELVQEFCAGYYREAGPSILAYVRAIRDSVYNPAPTNHHDEFAKIGDLRNLWLKPELLAQLRSLRAEALAAAGQDATLRRRVLEATMGVPAYDIYVPAAGSGTGAGSTGPLVEATHEGRSVLMRQNMGRYTYDEIADFLQNVRFTSPHEYGNGYKAREEQLALHGGPLVTLTQGDLNVKLAPAIKGQLRQITYKGVPCLHVATVQDGYPEYPVVGSSMQVLDPQVHTWRIVGTPTSTTAKTEANVGIGSWGGDLSTLIDGIARSAYTVEDPGSGPTLVIDSTIQATATGNRPWVQSTVETTYAVSSDPTAHTVTTNVALGLVTVKLPGQTWTLRDSYEGCTVTEITTQHDAARSTLTVRVVLSQVTSVVSSETSYGTRRISFTSP